MLLSGEKTTYNICKHSSTKEDHMPPPWRILNPYFEFL